MFTSEVKVLLSVRHQQGVNQHQNRLQQPTYHTFFDLIYSGGDRKIREGSIVVVGYFIFNHKITPSSIQKTAGLKIRKQPQNVIR